jgi:release factor glutamine methyltransferase
VSYAGLSIEQARRALSAELKASNIETPDLDARVLLGEALGLDLTALIAAGDRRLNEDEAARLTTFLERRKTGEPVARILGRKEFWGLSFALSDATLVPRPDTEAVVEAALDALKKDACTNDHLRIADLGTGSGAILLALLSELPNATGIGTDINPAALVIAEQNAERLGFAGRTSFIESDFASALSGRFDLIVSNPPYIRSRDIDDLALDVRAFDPHIALDGGNDGLGAYRVIAPQARRLLRPGGLLIVEVGRGQDREVPQIMAATGLLFDGLAKLDINGIARALTARNPLF